MLSKPLSHFSRYHLRFLRYRRVNERIISLSLSLSLIRTSRSRLVSPSCRILEIVRTSRRKCRSRAHSWSLSLSLKHMERNFNSLRILATDWNIGIKQRKRTSSIFSLALHPQNFQSFSHEKFKFPFEIVENWFNPRFNFVKEIQIFKFFNSTILLLKKLIFSSEKDHQTASKWILLQMDGR